MGWRWLTRQPTLIHAAVSISGPLQFLNEDREIIATREALVGDRRSLVLFFPGFVRSHFSVPACLLALGTSATGARFPGRSRLRGHGLAGDSDAVVRGTAGESLIKLVVSQILTTHLLKELSLTFESVVGSSFGNISAAYASGVLTLHESVQTAILFSSCVSPGKSILTRVTGVNEEILRGNLPTGAKILCKESATSFVVMTDDTENGSTLAEAAAAGAMRQTLISCEITQTADQIIKQMSKIVPRTRNKPSSWLAAEGVNDMISGADIVQTIMRFSDATHVL